ncbi:HEXXH motif domain-containing protein [Actinoplanes sp. M2I2]|uniref:HEXXH motif domain-containing protein n=1 Tax=Actinoplanes sp. M2I2 TaxID=1734444 RepID=UPI00201FB41A|nr:HEXXH motif domain-containing protein [Actinoplanes sp. M2I2]
MNPVTRHRLPTTSFATLARGEGSADITRDFWETEESRRLLLVSTLLTEIAEQPGGLGPLTPVGSALAILTEAQHRAPEAVRDLLMNPGVGSGCAYALRRLRGGAGGSAPLFVDLGIVPTIALVAAARAGLTWSARLPLRDGDLMLHTYGLARFAGSATTVEATTEGGVIRLHDGRHTLVVPGGKTAGDKTAGDEAAGDEVAGGSDAPRWWPLRRVEAGRTLRISVWLDDLDPMRDLGDPVPPSRLDDEAFERWRRLIEDAWDLLCRDYPADADAMAGGLTAIVPLKHLEGWDTRSASNGEAFGSVMVSEPPDEVIMAVSLIHEYQHIKLGALLHLIPMTGPDDGSLYYAPWRDDPRPLGGLVQGIYAFFGIARFWQTRMQKTTGAQREIAAFEYAYTLQQTVESVRIGLAAAGLTAAGRDLLAGLRDQVDEWLAKPSEAVEPRIERLARLTADSHRLGWRVRHCRPRADEVAALAALLRAGKVLEPATVTAAVVEPHPRLRWRQRIPVAARRHAVTGDQPRSATPDPVSAAEDALLARDAATARQGFTDALTGLAAGADPSISDDEARAWAGLAMSLAAEGDAPAADAVLRRPDLVRALYATTDRSVTPVDVARRLAPAFAATP